MAPASLLRISLSLLFTCIASVRATQTVWSAVAYVLNGERVPFRGPGTGHGSLTSLGATQMLSQGSLLRSRWLTNSSLQAGGSNATTNAPIVGIERSAIDNSQLVITSTREDYVTGGALAFMQGLYPPTTQAFGASNGGIEASVLANDTLIDFPLGGYMYPNIRTVSFSEPESVWLEGHVSCTEYLRATSNLKSNRGIAEVYNSSYAHYRQLWSTVFDGTFPLSAANFDSAYDLYDYASFQYTHNKTIKNALHADELNWLAEFANIQQFAKNGDLTVSGNQQGDKIRAISGRTLAGKVVSQFQQHIVTGGQTAKLSLMFGSFQPMLAFFSLSGLSTGLDSGMFQEIPNAGGVMIFELFSEGTNTLSFPSARDLWVRFLYRNGTDDDAPVYEYPLFGRGNSQTRMTWYDFVSGIRQFSINDVPSWCTICDSASVFCTGSKRTTGQGSSPLDNSSQNNFNLSPAVSGVIGAVMAIAVIAVAAVSLVVFGGFRLHRNSQKSPFGGFKGAEKMASDRDLSVAKTGANHERVGSWELGQPGGPAVDISKNVSNIGASRMREIDDDGDSILGREPMKPRESF